MYTRIQPSIRILKVFGLLLAAAVALSTSSAPLKPVRALTKPVIQRVMASVVQLGPVAEVKNKKGKVEIRYFGWGSGTILSSDGYILTNHHVTDVSSVIQEVANQKNVKIQEGKLVVLLTKRSDQAPVAAYIAEVVADSPDLDLAVVHITQDLSGKPVDAGSLNLAYVDVGDSDTLDLGDALNIFGYPGIGGNTITFTSGNVSGFDTEDGVQGRAWIKTDATIAGGNSGGTAVDKDAKLVGIPTQAAVPHGQVADCRRIADSNSDGQIDENDSCIPIGGFINALRPINLAKPLIEEAMGKGGNGQTSSSSEGVQVTGTIVDADTGQPISGAAFVVLKEGVTWDTYDDTDAQVLDAVRTDRRGLFEMTQRLERGKSYSFGWGAKKYQTEQRDDIAVTADTQDVVEVTLKLQKQ